MYEEDDTPQDPAQVAAEPQQRTAPQRPSGALTALSGMASDDPLSGLDPETLMIEARKFTDPGAVGRARAAGFLKPTQSRHFSANYYNALSGAEAAAARQEELLSRYLPVVQRAAQAKQAQKVLEEKLVREQRTNHLKVLNTTAAAALSDPNLTQDSLRQQIDSLVTQGQVPGDLANKFVRGLPADPVKLRQSLTQQALAATDPYRAVKLPTTETYKVGEVGYDVDPVTRKRTKVGEGGPKTTDLSTMLRELGDLALDDPRRAVYMDAIKKATTHPPAASMSVNAEKPLINSFMDVLGKSAAAERDTALGAKTAIDTAGRLLEVLKSPNVFTGPAAQAAVTAAQIAEIGGFGGKDNRERLANTQLALQSLAQLELDAASQMRGQGAITDTERTLLKKVAGGQITLTKPELQTLAIVARRNNKLRIDRYNKNAERLSKLEGLAQVAPLLRVEVDDLDSGSLVDYDAQGRPINPGVK